MRYILLIAVFMCGCASEEIKPSGPIERVFKAPYEQVWRATQLAMARYPRKIDDMDSGLLETETMRGEQSWKAPFPEPKVNSSGYRRRLQLRLLKGEFEGEPAIKVVVVKTAELLRNFLSDPEDLGSTGVEETMVLYRVHREIEIDDLIQNSAKKKKEDIELDDE